MIVSQRQESSSQGTVDALTWLQRQLAWEQVLRRLRRSAGVETDEQESPAEERPAA